MDEVPFSTDSLPGPNDIVRQVFPNGVTLLTRPNFSSPAVAIRGYLPPGAIAEPINKYGLANFTASMLMMGTRQLEFRELNDKIESMGASLAFSSGGLSTSFAGQCLKEDLPALLSLLKQALAEPAFPNRHFVRLKTQILTTIAIQAQDTGEMADQAFDRNFYDTHPYAHPEIGYPLTINALTLEYVVEFHRRYYGPKHLVLAISGGINPQEAIQTVEQTLGTYENPDQEEQPPLPDFTPPQHTRREHVPLEEKSQTDLVIGVMAPKTMGEDFHACTLGNSILGQFGMMGRIGESVREQAGLAYTIQSSLGSGLGPTSWQVSAGVNPDNLDRAIDLILKELQRFRSEEVTNEELEDVRAQAIGHLPLTLESNAGICSTLLSFERYDLNFNYLRTLPAVLEAITAEDILKCSQRYWNLDHLVITSAGRPLS